MSDVFISKGSTRGRIDPATEDLQQDIKTELQKSVATNSVNFGTQRITLSGAGLGAGASQACRECWISFETTANVHLAIKNSGDADATDFLLPPNVIIPLPVRNTSQIKLFGDSADLIYLMWRD